MDASQLNSIARKGNTAAVQQWLSQPAKKQNQTNVINSFYEGQTALHVAASGGRSELVSILLEVFDFSRTADQQIS